MIGELANHLWQSTLFALAAGLLTFAFRGNRAQIRYWLWFSASFKFFVPFAPLMSLGNHFDWALPAHTIAAPAVAFTMDQVTEPFPGVVSFRPSAANSTNWVLVALLVAWACGFVAIALTRYRGWRRIRAAVRSSVPLELPVTISVRAAPGLLEPGVVGLFRPILLLPVGLTEQLTPPQLETVLAHELCHVRRRDNLFASIHMLVEAIFWFHPLVWWIGARLVEERERACDEEVLRLFSEPRIYAEGILQVCKLCVESPLACVSGVTGANLRRRIEAIMTNRIGHRLNRAHKFLLASAGIAALAVPVVIGIGRAPAVQAQSPAASPLQFEVASLKPNKGCENRPMSFNPSPGRLDIPCFNLHDLVQTAFGVYGDGVRMNPQPFHIEGGPSWMQSEYYALSAKADGSTRMEIMAGPMLQSLLEERFLLRIHREMREIPVYALALGKGGLKVRALDEGACIPLDMRHPTPQPKQGDPPPNVCGFMTARPNGKGGMTIDVRGSTMTQLTQRLSVFLDRTVVDKTGIAGMFNFHLEFAPDPNMPGQSRFASRDGDAGNAGNPASPPADTGPGLLVAIQEQIGLKLAPDKGPVPFLIIDHAEKPSEN